MLIILAESHLTLDRFMLHSGNAGLEDYQFKKGDNAAPRKGSMNVKKDVVAPIKGSMKDDAPVDPRMRETSTRDSGRPREYLRLQGLRS